MSANPKPRAATPAPEPPRDKWRYGWRYVRGDRANGREDSKRVPLRKKDLLHPHEGDFIVNTPAHQQDCRYLVTVFQARAAGRSDVLVVTDHRVDWGVPGLEPFGPDIAAFEGVHNFDPTVGTFYTARWKARPLLAVEVTSLDTRRNDTVIKFRDYFRGRVPLYIIVDRMEARRRRAPTQLLAYCSAPNGYVPLPLDDQGRLWLEPFRLWLGVGENNQVVCYDEKGDRIPDAWEALRDLRRAKKRAEAAKERADAEKARADALEAELRRLRRGAK
jgi:Uma2 family endonuclease